MSLSGGRKVRSRLASRSTAAFDVAHASTRAEGSRWKCQLGFSMFQAKCTQTGLSLGNKKHPDLSHRSADNEIKRWPSSALNQYHLTQAYRLGILMFHLPSAFTPGSLLGNKKGTALCLKVRVYLDELSILMFHLPSALA